MIPKTKVDISIYKVLERNADGGLDEDKNPAIPLQVYRNHGEWVVLLIEDQEYMLPASILIDALKLVIR